MSYRPAPYGAASFSSRPIQTGALARSAHHGFGGAVTASQAVEAQMEWNGMCREKREGSKCDCISATNCSRCNACNQLIEIVHCKKNYSGEWVHTVCPNDGTRGMPSIMSGTVPSRANRLTITNGETGSSRHARASRPVPDFPLTSEQAAFLNQKHDPGLVVRVNARAGSGKTTIAALLSNRLVEEIPDCRILYVVFNKKNQTEAASSGKFPKQVLIKTVQGLAKKIGLPDGAPIAQPSPDEIRTRLGLDSKIRSHFGAYKGHTGAPDEDALKTKTSLDAILKNERRFRRAAKVVAGYIMRTMDAYAASADKKMGKQHLFWRCNEAGGKRTMWKNALRPEINDFYLRQAEELFKKMAPKTESGCGMTHQVYTKHFQLSGISLGQPINTRCSCGGTFEEKHSRYGRWFPCSNRGCTEKAKKGWDAIIVDECQDLTDCEANALFGAKPKQRPGFEKSEKLQREYAIEEAKHGDARIYLIGDFRQRLYSWRHARTAFENVPVDTEFELSQSFRFGKTIAKGATRVLRHVDPHLRIDGVAKESGHICRDKGDAKIVICRSNQGQIEHLHERILRNDGQCPKWGFVATKTGPGEIFEWKKYRKLYDLWAELNELGKLTDGSATMGGGGETEDPEEETENPHGIQKPLSYGSEKFYCWKDFKEFLDETDDSVTKQKVSLIEKFGQGLEAILQNAKQHYVPDYTAEECDVAFTTVHKAKGLEFDQPVLLAHDFFCEKHLLEQETARPKELGSRWNAHAKELMNLVYVGATRAKKELQLSDDVWEYFEALKAEQGDPGSDAESESSDVDERIHDAAAIQEIKGAKNEWIRLWEAFTKRQSLPTSVEDVPWPDKNFYLHADLTPGEARKEIRLMLLKFHPDKFFQRFSGGGDGQHWQDRELQGEVKKKVEETFHALSDLMTSDHESSKVDL